ncbi:RagB/SusD family nutrient uptake outer membrane protein [Lewinella sp. IMCC34183]|uniref:RagB/SusD family nutrient uptake outer membrane protein n=1 Tax=Lewinella sp. IMCC34183 TaxID=2248762 RepID=UPI000E275165|nr:RagB/SusD family nutrient uptake outer membrane protein [Lewinella sp. IMCC34183]
MQPLYKFLVLALLVAGAPACTDVLDRTPQGEYTLDNFFQTEEQAVQSVNAVYNQLRSWETHVFSFIGMTDIVSDDSDKGSTPSDGFFLQEIDQFTYAPTNVAPSTVWAGYYTGIFRANLVIENLPEVPAIDESLRTRLNGEASFLRAYFYFNLVRWFGGVPLLLEPFPTNFEIARASAGEVYAQIESDLQTAISALPASYAAADIGRATSGAAKSMLAKVALTRGNWQRAADLSLEVINSGRYELYPTFSGIFTQEGENSSESIFEVQAAAFEIGGGGSQYNEVQGVRGVPNLGWGFNRPSDDLAASFEAGDPRRDATILYVGEVLPDGSGIVEGDPNIDGERFNQKAFVTDHPGGNGNGPGNIRILRYADLLLIAAEALNELNRQEEALMYLNMVRARARGGANVLPDVTTTDQGELRQAIWRERRSELALEQHRWFDLVRTNRSFEVMKPLRPNFTQNKNELFPIPQTEIDLSEGALEQNPGYN